MNCFNVCKSPSFFIKKEKPSEGSNFVHKIFLAWFSWYVVCDFVMSSWALFTARYVLCGSRKIRC